MVFFQQKNGIIVKRFSDESDSSGALLESREAKRDFIANVQALKRGLEAKTGVKLIAQMLPYKNGEFRAFLKVVS